MKKLLPLLVVLLTVIFVFDSYVKPSAPLLGVQPVSEGQPALSVSKANLTFTNPSKENLKDVVVFFTGTKRVFKVVPKECTFIPKYNWSCVFDSPKNSSQVFLAKITQTNRVFYSYGSAKWGEVFEKAIIR